MSRYRCVRFDLSTSHLKPPERTHHDGSHIAHPSSELWSSRPVHVRGEGGTSSEWHPSGIVLPSLPTARLLADLSMGMPRHRHLRRISLRASPAGPLKWLYSSRHMETRAIV